MEGIQAEESSHDLMRSATTNAASNGELLALCSNAPDATAVVSSTLTLPLSARAGHVSVPAQTSASQPQDSAAIASVFLPLDNRIITSAVTAQALAESMRSQLLSEMRRQKLLRRYSAYDDASQFSSREEVYSPRSIHESSASIKRSMDAEEGVQHLRAKAAVMLRDKINANRLGVKRIAVASGVASASFFTAAMLAVSASSHSLTGEDSIQKQDRDSAQEEYEQMMKRFQLRRLQRSLSNISSADEQLETAGKAKSARAAPVPSPMTNEGSMYTAGTVQPHPASGETPTADTAQSIAITAPSTSVVSPLKRIRSAIVDPGINRTNLSLPTERGRGQHTHRDTVGACSMYESQVVHISGGQSRPRWRSIMRRMRRRLLHRFSSPMSPYSRTFAVRSAIVLAACAVQIVYNPYEIAFTMKQTSEDTAVMAALETIFLVDFVLTFNTSIIDKRGILVTSRSEIAYRYLSGWGIPQFFASIPLSSILHATTNQEHIWIHYAHMLYDSSVRMQHLVQILQLYYRVGNLHVGRSSKSIWGWVLYSRFSHLVRLTWLLVAILLIAHYFACAWKMLQLPISPPRSGRRVMLEEYAACFYGAMQLLEGQGQTTETLAQNVFSSVAVLLGAIVLAIIYGHVTMLVSNFNANATGYQRKMETVFAMMDKMQLPASLRERIHQYYQHLWREYESLDGEIVKFSKDLTHNLALEVSLFKYMELTMHVPFWKMCSPDFQKQLVLSLQVRVYLPDDFIMRRGEVSDEFYMINRGVCEIIRGKDSVEHCTTALRSRRRRSSNPQAIEPLSDTFAMPNDGARNEFEGHFTVSGDTSDTVTKAKAHPSATVRSDTTVTIDNTRQQSESLPGSDIISTRLGRGQTFGEAALLLNYPRSANARAVAYVEMCILSREAFQTILARHPDDRKHVLKQILTWMMRNNEFHHISCQLKEMVEEAFSESRSDATTRFNVIDAAELLVEAFDPLGEEKPTTRLRYKYGQLLSNFQVKDFTARSRYNSKAAPVHATDSIHPTASPCVSRSTFSNPTETGFVGPSAVSGTHSRSDDCSILSQLDSCLDGTDQNQIRSIQLVSKICRTVEELKSASAPPLPWTHSRKLKVLQNSLSPVTHNTQQRKTSLKRSMSTSKVVSQTTPLEKQHFMLRSISKGDPGFTNDSPSPSTLPEETTAVRRDSSQSAYRPILRRMSSLVGLSKSALTAETVEESPTRLADQLFQQNTSQRD